MSKREWTAAIQLLGVLVVAGWLGLEATNGAFENAGFADVAMKLVIAVVVGIVFSIAGTILIVIIVSIVTRTELNDEKADERDVAIDARSMRNGAVVTSSLAGLALLAVAFGWPPVLAVYALFVAPLLGGATDAASRLVYYRIG